MGRVYSVEKSDKINFWPLSRFMLRQDDDRFLEVYCVHKVAQ